MKQLIKVEVEDNNGDLSVKRETRNIRIIRNFFIDLYVDGIKHKISTGPKGKDKGFHMDIFMRDKGEPKRVMMISGTSGGDDLLLLVTTDTDSKDNKEKTIAIMTKR